MVVKLGGNAMVDADPVPVLRGRRRAAPRPSGSSRSSSTAAVPRSASCWPSWARRPSSATGCGSPTPRPSTWPAWCSPARSGATSSAPSTARPGRRRAVGRGRRADRRHPARRGPRLRRRRGRRRTARSSTRCSRGQFIPVISTIGADGTGQAFNINADSAAIAIAEALDAEKLIYLTDVPGVLTDVDDPAVADLPALGRPGPPAHRRRRDRRRDDPEGRGLPRGRRRPGSARPTSSTAASPTSSCSSCSPTGRRHHGHPHRRRRRRDRADGHGGHARPAGLDAARSCRPTGRRSQFVRGEGTRLWDADGNEYLDFLTGLAVCSLGHSHPAVAEALSRAGPDPPARLEPLRQPSSARRWRHPRPAARHAGWADGWSTAGPGRSSPTPAPRPTSAPSSWPGKWGGRGRHVVVSALGSFHGRTLATLARHRPAGQARGRSSRCPRASATWRGTTSTPSRRPSTRPSPPCCSSRSRARAASTRPPPSTSRASGGSATSGASCSWSTRCRPASGRTGRVVRPPALRRGARRRHHGQGARQRRAHRGLLGPGRGGRASSCPATTAPPTAASPSPPPRPGPCWPSMEASDVPGPGRRRRAPRWPPPSADLPGVASVRGLGPAARRRARRRHRRPATVAAEAPPARPGRQRRHAHRAAARPAADRHRRRDRPRPSPSSADVLAGLAPTPPSGGPA